MFIRTRELKRGASYEKFLVNKGRRFYQKAIAQNTGHGKKGETKLSSPFSFSVPGREGQVVATMKTIPVPPEQMDLPYICSAGTINDRIKLEDTLSTPFYTDDGLKCFNICVVNYGGEGAHIPAGSILGESFSPDIDPVELRGGLGSKKMGPKGRTGGGKFLPD